jgi:hypothetical protein
LDLRLNILEIFSLSVWDSGEHLRELASMWQRSPLNQLIGAVVSNEISESLSFR